MIAQHPWIAVIIVASLAAAGLFAAAIVVSSALSWAWSAYLGYFHAVGVQLGSPQ